MKVQNCIEIWRIAYSNNLRRLLGMLQYNSASEMFVCLNISSISELLRKYTYSYRSRRMTSHNCILFSRLCVLQLSLCILLYGLGGNAFSLHSCNILQFIIVLACTVICVLYSIMCIIIMDYMWW